ncbi:AMP-binding protein [Cellulomonas soli]|uniref:AMP-dependent synthetase/ligase domain-containing protein n=1 Tax=Cellulomonas soli TaxID=931535 RepID=A0A512PIQ6_9CELL|nr:AMP-binding protein [Cellulomonas soli]NYI58847.1 acyl-CoA synthetase (AMP-forming)/AMP-acid ligase II [Cellulomonas soli]GEP71088.1 hypothetical protein CSO01_38030 [Cellulomonas soli]
MVSSEVTSPPAVEPVWRDLATRAIDHAPGRASGRRRTDVGWKILAHRSVQIASGLHAVGVRHGDRVSLIVEPGPERTAVAYACWRLGAVVVTTAPELTLRQQAQAHAVARPEVVVADSRGLVLTRGLRSPRLRIATERVPVLDELALGARYHLADLVTRRLLLSLPLPPAPDDDAALVFAGTGEPVGVHYTQSDLGRLREIAADRASVAALADGSVRRSRPAVERRDATVGATSTASAFGSGARAGSLLVAAALVAPILR